MTPNPSLKRVAIVIVGTVTTTNSEQA